MLAYPFWDRRRRFRTADRASTAASKKWCSLGSRTGRAGRHEAGASAGSTPPDTGAGAGEVTACWVEVMWGRSLADALGLLGSVAVAEAGSSGQRPQQPIEVVLVVPRPDRRSQPGASWNVTHDDPVLG